MNNHPMTRTAYIYTLCDPDGVPFYVGKTVRPKFRVYGHMQMARSNSNLHVANKLRRILADNPQFKLSLTIIDEAPENEIDQLERFHIKRLLEEGVELTNLSPGGEGGCTPEAAMKGIAKRREDGTLAHSEQTRKKIGDALRGKPKSDEHKAALKKSWKRTPEQLARAAAKAAITSSGRINIKKYTCVSPDGTEYETSNGLSAFCRDHGLTISAMAAVANGRKSHHRGWTCRHVDERNDTVGPANH